MWTLHDVHVYTLLVTVIKLSTKYYAVSLPSTGPEGVKITTDSTIHVQYTVVSY